MTNARLLVVEDSAVGADMIDAGKRLGWSPSLASNLEDARQIFSGFCQEDGNKKAICLDLMLAPTRLAAEKYKLLMGDRLKISRRIVRLLDDDSQEAEREMSELRGQLSQIDNDCTKFVDERAGLRFLAADDVTEGIKAKKVPIAVLTCISEQKLKELLQEPEFQKVLDLYKIQAFKFFEKPFAIVDLEGWLKGLAPN